MLEYIKYRLLRNDNKKCTTINTYKFWEVYNDKNLTIEEKIQKIKELDEQLERHIGTKLVYLESFKEENRDVK